jgi:SAM-dependent methyltransferase
MADQPHSADQFTASRDLWWNGDYLALLARRHDLGACRAVLELGAGVGHWTAIIAGLVAPDARITATDREAAWVERLETRFASDRRVVVGQLDASHLADQLAAPPPVTLDGSYDLVTCQTVLMHLPDVPSVLAQVTRLLRPGGLLLAVEPNNFLNRLPMSSVAHTLTPGEFGQLAAFWWAFELGRRKLGLGSELVAELLPKMIVDAGFTGLSVTVADRAFPSFPPYDTPEQAAALADDQARTASGAQMREYALTRSHVLAGGLDETAFLRGWTLHLEVERRAAQALQNQTFSCAGNSGSMFVFAARRPLGVSSAP